MTRKYVRVIAPRILYVLDQNLGVGIRFNEIFKALAEAGWLHSQRPISDNLKFLIEQGKVAKIKSRYALIKTWENGSKFVIVNDPVERVIELEK